MQQMGFDLDYTDPVTHQAVPWAEVTRSLLERIKNAPFKLVDTETTGLNPSSKEQNFSNRKLQAGVRPELRMRVATVLIPTPTGFPVAERYLVTAFDMDKLTEGEREQVCSASLSGVVFAHNAGFDGYWLRCHSKQEPQLLLDTMLISRVLVPDHPVVMARMCSDENEEEELRAEAHNMFMGGASGWSLAHLSVGLLRRVLPKKMQGPKNWCEPFLTQEAYDYATGDTEVMLDIILKIFELDDPTEILNRYYELREEYPALRIVEPQVWDIVQMRETGMPWDQAVSAKYVKAQHAIVKEYAELMVKLEPTLEPYSMTLADPSAGITATLKEVIGAAFSARGIEVQVTEKTGTFKIGEKDLRKVRAAISEESKDLFKTWVKLNRAKKAGGMAQEVSKFARRSFDERLHPNTGHGPVTGRLASSEPNCQQFPRDQNFRNCVAAPLGYKISSADYSALDMRVGAALAIRAQQQILDCYVGERFCSPDVLRCIGLVMEDKLTFPAAVAMEKEASLHFEQWKARRDEAKEGGRDAVNRYWETYRRLQRRQLLSGFQRCLAEVRMRAELAGTPEWGSLRDAFSVDGMDIHTWTALDMTGRNPKDLFAGLEGEAVSKALKKWKGELGDVRQTGKVGNLSLLYAMQSFGLQEAAAKNYDIHWTIDEAADVRQKWLAAYVEIDLWHKWTELNPKETVQIPDKDRGGKIVKKQVYESITLGNRRIMAFGLNAALSYEDQSTGADILGRVMEQFRNYPEILKTVVNQVHDEVLFQIPNDKVDEYHAVIGKVMGDAAEHFLMPYGVQADCVPEAGDVWLKG